MNRLLLAVLVMFSSVGHLLGQRSLSVNANSGGMPGIYYYGANHEAPRAIRFEHGTVPTSSFIANINQYLNVSDEFTFVEVESNTDQLGMRHRLLQQYYHGIPLEGLSYRLHEKNGYVTSVNGKGVRELELSTESLVSEQAAFYLATSHLKSRDSSFRPAKKMIVSRQFTFAPGSFSLAFQFDIDVSLIEQWRISIDARDGSIINKVSLVNTCFGETPHPPPYGRGTGLTNYYGRQGIAIEKYNGGSSRLVGQTEHGGRIGTYNFQNVSIISLILFFEYHKVYDFYSSTDTYDEVYQRPAVSAQWAAEQVFEYYYNRHGRNSFDNLGSEVKCYVHVDQNMNNAFWTHNLMAFGDGSNNNPLVQLDVVGHEFTHGVTQYEAALNYYNESGALNESFSDILGKAIEFDKFGDTTSWQVAKHYSPGGLRDMSNPNLKNQPDTYGGDMWFTGAEDNGGVHYNSGVQNFWYYLLCEGGNGTNDHGVNYSINAIGAEAATKIAYRNLTEYLTTTSDYLDSRIGSMLAAADIYGLNSTEYQEVDKAWDAVGVIDEPIVTSLNIYDVTATTAKITGSMFPRGNSVTYRFEYGTTSALGTTSPTYTYNGTIEGMLTGLQSQTKYFFRVAATNENGTTYYNVNPFTTLSLAPLVEIKNTVDVTETTAVVYGKINPNSLPTSFHFEYGLTPALGQSTISYPLSDGATEYIDMSAEIAELLPRKTYYYKLVATNGFSSTSSATISLFTAVKPVISSFTPHAAPIDTEVVISGSNFNPVLGKNVVSFGATIAPIISSTTTEIKVLVPAGASLGPISVLDLESGLATQSVHEFVQMFDGEFTKSSMQLRIGLNNVNTYGSAVQDMDGDNKPDVVVSNYRGFTVMQNVNQGGDITEQSFVMNIQNSADLADDQVFVVDIDGDGRKDVAMRYYGGVRLFPNLSVPGFIFFGIPVDVPTEYLRELTFGDFDKDGHIDFAGISALAGEDYVTIYRNLNSKTMFAAGNFTKQYTKPVAYDNYLLTSGDLNNDNALDLIVSTHATTFFLILKNNSRPGFFDFEESIVPDPTRQQYFARYFSNDLNNDGWSDIISHNHYYSGVVSIFENKGSGGITMSAPYSVLNEYPATDARGGDLNGDGNVDIVASTDKRISFVLVNKTRAGDALSASSFEKFSEFGLPLAGNGEKADTRTTISDLNGDGRPEIINSHSYNYGPRYDGYQFEIWQNSTTDCPIDPADVKLDISNNTVSIILPPNTTQDDFEFEYKQNGYDRWYRITSNSIYVSADYTYTFRARAKCYLGFTEYYEITFTPECVNTSSFTINSIGPDQVTLYAHDLYSLYVQYSRAGEEQWFDVAQGSTTILNLMPGTKYDVRYRGRCSVLSNYKYKSFITACPNLSSLTVTDITFSSAKVNWATQYQGNVVIEYSSDNAVWTTLNGQIITSLTPGKEYFVRGKFACTDAISDYKLTMFRTHCPALSSLTIDQVIPFTARISWVDPAQTASYTVTYVSSGNVKKTIETSSTFVDIDDLEAGTVYTVSVAPHCLSTGIITTKEFTTICYSPYNLEVSELGYNSAMLSWDDDFDALPYHIEYRIAESGQWTKVVQTTRRLPLTGLRSVTKYEVRISIVCANLTAPYLTQYFTTKAYEATTFGPNPTDDKVTIHPSKDLIGNRYTLIDNAGRIVAQGFMRSYTFDLSGLSSGLFILKIEGEDPMKIFKHHK
jgi:Zn-dependent metalloprotease